VPTAKKPKFCLLWGQTTLLIIVYIITYWWQSARTGFLLYSDEKVGKKVGVNYLK
jgi:hypothetical protein